MSACGGTREDLRGRARPLAIWPVEARKARAGEMRQGMGMVPDKGQGLPVMGPSGLVTSHVRVYI